MRAKDFHRGLLLVALLPLLAIVSLGCSKTSNAGSNSETRAARIESSLDRLARVLTLNADGTVSFDETKPDYASLVRGDAAFGKAILASLNVKIQEGLIRVNSDFSAEWLGSPSSCSQCVEGSSCKRHWWGEECNVSTSTTRDICISLQSGEGALLICSVIPVVDVACEIIEVVGSIPLEAEICPCADKGDSSTFHVTWVGAAWFTCN
ncbi:MAG: hypothetical protein V1766_09060 [Pseudomonadota bacterium]